MCVSVPECPSTVGTCAYYKNMLRKKIEANNMLSKKIHDAHYKGPAPHGDCVHTLPRGTQGDTKEIACMRCHVALTRASGWRLTISTAVREHSTP